MRLDQTASGRTRYGTPPEFVAWVESLFGTIELDVAADEELHVCPHWIDDIMAPWPKVPYGDDPEPGALRRPELAWCNPPYGRQVGAFLERCRRAADNDEARCVVCLVPARTDTKWFHEATSIWAHGGTYTMLLSGRIRFLGMQHSAPFPSALIVYGWPPRHEWSAKARVSSIWTIEWRNS